MAFLISVGLGWAFVDLCDDFYGWFISFYRYRFSHLAERYLGSLFATAINENLWENNSPPSARIQTEVHQRHVEVIGEPKRRDVGRNDF
jgi:hypothetical protein